MTLVVGSAENNAKPIVAPRAAAGRLCLHAISSVILWLLRMACFLVRRAIVLFNVSRSCASEFVVVVLRNYIYDFVQRGLECNPRLLSCCAHLYGASAFEIAKSEI